MGTTQECYVLFWTNSGNNILRNNSCIATYVPSPKLSKYDKKKEIPGTAGKGRTNSWVTLTHGFFVVALKGQKWITQRDVRFTAEYIYKNTSNWLEPLASFIERVTIFSVEEGPCSDVMGYISITFSNIDVPVLYNQQWLTCISFVQTLIPV